MLEVHENTDELVIAIETNATVASCALCGARADAHDRMSIETRDLPCFGRPARLVWRKRRWRCRERLCDAKTWTEHSDHFDAQRVITRRAGREVPAKSVSWRVRCRKSPTSSACAGGRS